MDVSRPPRVADEPAMLAAYIDRHRGVLAAKCAGLSPAQLVERASPPSSMSLLGLVRHVTDVERGWFQRVLAGRDAPPLYTGDPANPDGDFDDADPAGADVAFAAWHEACSLSREIVAALPSLETLHQHRFGELSARWVLLHMIEEYARHNGHADLLRERIDGSVGEAG